MNSAFKNSLYWELFISFVKIGTFTIGGGYAMLPIIEKEVVDKRKWIDPNDWLDMIVLAQTAPGILAMNISVLVGHRIKGRRGAFSAALGACLPSFIIILIIAIFMSHVQDNVYVEKMFRTVRPAVVALIAAPLLSLGKSAKVNIWNIWYVAAVALGIWILGVSPIYIILGAIAAGSLYTLFINFKKRK